MHEPLVEIALRPRRGPPEILEQLVRLESAPVAHELERLGDGRGVGHAAEDRAIRSAPCLPSLPGASGTPSSSGSPTPRARPPRPTSSRPPQRLSAIAGVEAFEILRETSPKNDYRFGISMEFADDAAYQAYNDHPDHVAFVQGRWIPEVSEFLEIDYQTR